MVPLQEVERWPMQVLKITHCNWAIDTDTGDYIFSGRVCAHDIRALELPALDRLILREPVTTSADFLQNMEILFRRLGEKNDGEHRSRRASRAMGGEHVYSPPEDERLRAAGVAGPALPSTDSPILDRVQEEGQGAGTVAGGDHLNPKEPGL